MTPLIMAAYLGHAAVITALINAGADVNAQDDRGETALSAVRSRTRGLRTVGFNIGSWELVWKRKVGHEDDGYDELVGLLVEAGAK
jgi:Ankyrin repeats (many copies)